MHNFEENSQDVIATTIITGAGALSSIWDGNLDAAFMMLNRRWASLPGGSQQAITTEEAKAYFWNQLGEPIR